MDTDGRALELQANAADIQDRDDACPQVATASTIRVEIVRKLEGRVGFAVHVRRWAVERLFAWINRNRRLARDFGVTIASAETFFYAASVILTRRNWHGDGPIRARLSARVF